MLVFKIEPTLDVGLQHFLPFEFTGSKLGVRAVILSHQL